MYHGARASAKVMTTQYRISPLVQGGLEIPIKVTIEMDQIEANKLAVNEDATDSISARLNGEGSDFSDTNIDFNI